MLLPPQARSQGAPVSTRAAIPMTISSSSLPPRPDDAHDGEEDAVDDERVLGGEPEQLGENRRGHPAEERPPERVGTAEDDEDEEPHGDEEAHVLGALN